MWIRVSFQALMIVVLSFGFSIGDSHAADSMAAANSLKSAYLGPSVWEDGLSPQEVNQQLREHFAVVVDQLEKDQASSLLTALRRAEATSTQGWTKDQRKQTLIALAQNRQTQIARLQQYASRGLFPINEGQSDRAVPIFVDQQKTHCAVGYLMHVDGHDSAVAEVVAANNLVQVMDAKLAGLSDWVRMSGLTREEAALIQPAYPFPADASLLELQTTTPVLSLNGYTISETVVKHAVLDSTLLAGPDWQFERAMLDAQTTNATPALDQINMVNGVLFGSGDFFLGGFFGSGPPNHLSDWIYFGDVSGDLFDGTGGFTPATVRNGSDPSIQSLQLASLEYRISPDSGKFTQFALTTSGVNDNFHPLTDSGPEESALRLFAEIYDGTTDQLLGTIELSVNSDIGASAHQLLNLDADSLRIKTYGLKEGRYARVDSFFHEFDTAVQTVLGDCNLDGVVDFLDIGPFISILSDRGFLAEADVDEDGDVDFLDIIPFAEILSL